MIKKNGTAALAVIITGIIVISGYLLGINDRKQVKNVNQATRYRTVSQEEAAQTIRKVNYSQDWIKLEESFGELVLANINKPVRYENSTYVPNEGQVVVHIGLVHSALENYSGKRLLKTDSRGNSIVSWGRYLEAGEGLGITSYYWDNDPNIARYEKMINLLVKQNNSME